MKQVVVPQYYASFACVAGACRHTCCVGWEIDIDADTLARYEALPGVMGERIRASIDYPDDGIPCFRLTADERCPHLDADGLCTIITELGATALCGICRDHPRFRNHLPGAIELGLGLCCEAACALILDQREPMRLVILPEPQATEERAIAAIQAVGLEPDAEEEALLESLCNKRDEALTIVTDRTCSLDERLKRLAASVDGLLMPAVAPDAWADFLEGLERLDPAWDTCLTALRDVKPMVGKMQAMDELSSTDEVAYEHLLGYFLYRYMTSSADLYVPVPARLRVSFAVASVMLIHAITRATGEDVREVARMFSCEVEYSEENRAAFFDFLTESFI